MRFKFLMRNPYELMESEDLVLLLRLLLESAGHEVDYDFRSADPEACYVLFDPGCFGEDETPEWVRSRGRQVILLAREYILGDQYRDRSPDNAFPEETNHPDGYRRCRRFLRCARHARAVWCAATGQEALYSQLLGGLPVHRLPYPFFPNFLPLKHRENKDIDVHFSGRMTPHRDAIMERLKNAEVKFYYSNTRTPEYLRQDFLSRTKIRLCIKQTPDWPFPSPLRYWHALSNACCLLREACAAPSEFDHCLVTAQSENVAAGCMELLASGQWQPLAAETHQRFAAGPPCREAAQRLLDLTFSQP